MYIVEHVKLFELILNKYYLYISGYSYVCKNVTAYMIGAHKYHLSFYKPNVGFKYNFLQV